MLTKLTLINFQAHRKTIIELDPLVTTIIGSSDKGKSAIIRALRWLAFNSPSGKSFIKWGAKQARVKLEVDGHLIKRTRGTDNTYHLGEEEYKSFGNGNVPEEIEQVLNLSEVNFQAQFDSPFWFSETAGEVSRQLNRIVNLEIIDKTLSQLAGNLKKKNSVVEVTKDRLTKAKEDRTSLKFAREMDSDLRKVEDLETGLKNKAQKTAVLQSLLSDIQSHSKRLDRALDSKETGQIAITVGDLWCESRAKRVSLENLLDQIEEKEKKIKIKPPSLTKLERLATAMEEAQSQAEGLEKMIKSIKRHEKSIKTLTNDIEMVSIDIEKEQKDQEVCETCGQAIQNQ